MTGREDFEALAAEYALGVLDGLERREAEALLARDPAFAAAVARWRDQLAPLAEEAAPAVPSAGLWDRIEAEIEPAPTFRMAEAPRESLWSSLAFWRGFSAIATMSAAALAVIVVLPPPAPPQPSGFQNAVATGPVMAAPVMGESGALVAAAYDPKDSMVVVTPTGKVPLTAAQSMELWIIVGDKAPRSLGVIDPANPSLHRMPADVRKELAAGAALAISIEPRGGSPTGAPTGPVVAQGKLTAI